jgi:UDP-N-acetylmuramoylalanine--D-glutamate ligase
MNDFAGKRVLVVGLGISGFSAARVLSSLEAKVRVTESSSTEAILERAEALRHESIEVETGSHDHDRLDADIAVASPGIPLDAAVVQTLRKRGIELIGEFELGYRLRPDLSYLAVTGTNGKTTTTSLLSTMLDETGMRVLTAGNIGLPLAEAVVGAPGDAVVAVEVSSFQLATTDGFRPKVGVLLNVAEDHTDWHGSFENYVVAKGRIVENQQPGDVFVYNAEDAHAVKVAAGARSRTVPFSAVGSAAGGAGVAEGEMTWQGKPLIAASELPLVGRAGVEDTAAAAAAALSFGADREAVVRAIKSFRPLGHRLEVVAQTEGIVFIDDSKATNPHATVAAVADLTDVVLIAGGRAKGIDLAPMAQVVPPVTAVIAMGEAAEEVSEVFGELVTVERARDMQDAVSRALELVPPEGSVVLSPGCASLDMYESYAQRGEDFARAVRAAIGDRRWTRRSRRGR